MKLERHFFIGKVLFSFGISTELWHTTRKNDSKVIHLINIGFVPDVLPEKKIKPSIFVVTIMWLTLKVGIMR